MRRNDILWRLARTGLAALLATTFAAQAAEAALPTGGMMRAKPKGPARADLPSPTSISATRIPSAAAYGIVGEPVLFHDGAAIAGETPAAPAEKPAPPQTAAVDQPNPFAVPEPAAAGEDATPPADSVAEETPFDATEPVAAAPTDEDFAGLKGICPVTLREERRVVTPKPELFSDYAGRRYEFATPEAKAAFDADPDRYAPVLGGRDVVLTAGGAEEAVGSLKHAGFYRERLYLFQTEESYKEFYANPRRFIVGE